MHERLSAIAILLSSFITTAIAQGCSIVVGLAGPETITIRSTNLEAFSIGWTRSVLDGHTCTGVLILTGSIITRDYYGLVFSTNFIQSTGAASALLTVSFLTSSDLTPNVIRMPMTVYGAQEGPYSPFARTTPYFSVTDGSTFDNLPGATPGPTKASSSVTPVITSTFVTTITTTNENGQLTTFTATQAVTVSQATPTPSSGRFTTAELAGIICAVIFGVLTAVFGAMAVYYTRNMDRRQVAMAKINHLTGGRIFPNNPQIRPPGRRGVEEAEMGPLAPRY